MKPSPTLRLSSDAPILYALALLAPAVAPIGPVLIWIPAVAAACAVALRRAVAGGPWPVSAPALTALLFAIIAWSAITALWAIDPAESLHTAGRLLVVAVSLIVLLDAALRLGAGERARFRRWLVYGAAAAVLITLARIALISGYTVWMRHEAMSEIKLAALNRTATIIAILAWPAALSISRTYGRRWAIAFCAVAGATVFLLAPATPLLALVIGALAFAVAWYLPATAKVILLVVFALFICIVPFFDTLTPWATELLTKNFTAPVSEVHRFVIWRFVGEHILERPVFGWGLEAARVFPGRETQLFLLTWPDGTPATGPALPLHPHNAVVQIWLELGLIGVALFAALFVLAVRTIASAGGEHARSAVTTATIATALVIAQFGFGIWQGWWLATLGLAAVMIAAVSAGSPTSDAKPGADRRRQENSR